MFLFGPSQVELCIGIDRLVVESVQNCSLIIVIPLAARFKNEYKIHRKSTKIKQNSKFLIAVYCGYTQRAKCLIKCY